MPMFAIAVIASVVCGSCDALKLAAVDAKAQGKPDVQNHSHVLILANATGDGHKGLLQRLFASGLRGSTSEGINNTSPFTSGSGISIDGESHFLVEEEVNVVEDGLVEDGVMRQDPASSQYWEKRPHFGETSKTGWACVSLFIVVWMLWGFELLWAACVQQCIGSVAMIAHVFGGILMVRACGVAFGSFAQLAATYLLSFLLIIDVLFWMLWEVTRRLHTGAPQNVRTPSAAWTRKAQLADLQLLQAKVGGDVLEGPALRCP